MTASRTEPTDQIYTCPLHPEVRNKRAGHCPMCGAKLELKGRGQQVRIPR